MRYVGEKLAEKKVEKSDLKNLEKPQHFRLSTSKIPKLVMLQQLPRGMLVISNLLFLNYREKLMLSLAFAAIEEHKSFVWPNLAISLLDGHICSG